MLTIMQCKSRNNNIIAINYRLKMSFWFEVKKEITNQISKYFQIKSHAATFKSTQIKSSNQPKSLHFDLFHIFESSNIWITPDLNTTLPLLHKNKTGNATVQTLKTSKEEVVIIVRNWNRQLLIYSNNYLSIFLAIPNN